MKHAHLLGLLSQLNDKCSLLSDWTVSLFHCDWDLDQSRSRLCTCVRVLKRNVKTKCVKTLQNARKPHCTIEVYLPDVSFTLKTNISTIISCRKAPDWCNEIHQNSGKCLILKMNGWISLAAYSTWIDILAQFTQYCFHSCSVCAVGLLSHDAEAGDADDQSAVCVMWAGSGTHSIDFGKRLWSESMLLPSMLEFLSRLQ